MTTPWSMAPKRPRRGRRMAALLGLAAIFAVGLTAGWAVSDPAAFEAAVARTPLAGTPLDPGRAAAASPTPSVPGGSPAATPTPTSAAPGSGAASAAPGTPRPSGTLLPVGSPAAPSPTPIASPPPTVSPAMAKKLDRALATARSSLKLPGVQATVLFPDGSTWTGALGTADAATGRAVTPRTPFAIASVTKTFTAALILRDVDAGTIRLDDRLSQWLPDWPNGQKITIRMLLNHTSGIPDFFKNPTFDKALNKDKKRTWTADEVLAKYVRSSPVFPPGKGWSYSNTNYVLLGIVAEKVGGAPWAELVHRELIDPLGLTSTFVQAVDDPPATPARAYTLVAGDKGTTAKARTDGTDIVPFTSVVTAAGSAGAIASTTGDLARWARALYGGHVLTPATRKQMLTFVKAYSYGYATTYGLGVSRVRFQDRTSYGHSGALTGTRAAIRYFPKEKVAVAVLFNRESFVGDDVVRILARALFPTAKPTPSPATSPGSSKAP